MYGPGSGGDAILADAKCIDSRLSEEEARSRRLLAREMVIHWLLQCKLVLTMCVPTCGRDRMLGAVAVLRVKPGNCSSCSLTVRAIFVLHIFCWQKVTFTAT
jgi:hypothetical protein